MDKKIPNFEQLDNLHTEINTETNSDEPSVEAIKAKYKKLALLATYININPNTSPV